ncbi:MAG: tetratricopeptide repeat protein [Myxococcota bacterium]
MRRFIEMSARGLVVALCVFGALSSVWVGVSLAEENEERDEAEPDYVSLAGMLVRDGHYERAATELAKVDPAKEGVDTKLYYTLQGLIALRTGAYEQAVGHFDEAIKHGQTDDIVFVYLAQAYYNLKQWERTILSVRNADEAGEDIPDLYLMKATAHKKLEQRQQAWETLLAGGEQFPERTEFLRQRVFLLIDMGLYQEAMTLGHTYFEVAEPTVDDYIAIGEALRRAGVHDRAQVIFEEARLRYPDKNKIVVHLAHTYLATGHMLTAGELMQIAAEDDPKYIMEAAELFRRGGAYQRALYMNSQVVDQKAKFKQRVSILLDQRRFVNIAAMEARLSRLGLLEDQNILYTLAYANFKAGDYEDAERLLRRITDSELFKSAVELRRAIQVCAEEPWRC